MFRPNVNTTSAAPAGQSTSGESSRPPFETTSTMGSRAGFSASTASSWASTGSADTIIPTAHAAASRRELPASSAAESSSSSSLAYSASSTSTVAAAISAPLTLSQQATLSIDYTISRLAIIVTASVRNSSVLHEIFSGCLAKQPSIDSYTPSAGSIPNVDPNDTGRSYLAYHYPSSIQFKYFFGRLTTAQKEQLDVILQQLMAEYPLPAAEDDAPVDVQQRTSSISTCSPGGKDSPYSCLVTVERGVAIIARLHDLLGQFNTANGIFPSRGKLSMAQSVMAMASQPVVSQSPIPAVVSMMPPPMRSHAPMASAQLGGTQNPPPLVSGLFRSGTLSSAAASSRRFDSQSSSAAFPGPRR